MQRIKRIWADFGKAKTKLPQKIAFIRQICPNASSLGLSGSLGKPFSTTCVLVLMC